MLAVGEFELEFNSSGAVFVEEDDLAVIAIRPVGFSEEGGNFFFGGMDRKWCELTLDEKTAGEIFKGDKGRSQNAFCRAKLVAVLIGFESFFLA